MSIIEGVYDVDLLWRIEIEVMKWIDTSIIECLL
jgi:hypothetical protein